MDSHAVSEPHAAELRDNVDTAKRTLEEQRTTLEGVNSQADRHREEAESLRAAVISERQDAAQRVEQVRADNLAAGNVHDEDTAGAVFAASFLAGFVLLPLARWVAGLVSRWLMVVTLLTGTIVAFSLLGLSASLGSLGTRFTVIAISGLLLSFVLMLVRVWLLAAVLPRKFGMTLVGVAAVVAVLVIAGIAGTAEPVPQQVVQADQAMVEEAQKDPKAEELQEARTADAAAADLQADVDVLMSDLEDISATVKELEADATSADAKAKADQDAVTSAQDVLASLE
ncbi:hypothetical protein [Aeromicrobium sp. CF3.5]|uniref:hypothetical protein n=1 Tax=Aeromicrobium sp. CF3.5 TaxID=3373078 RepID=UPI003EE7C547